MMLPVTRKLAGYLQQGNPTYGIVAAKRCAVSGIYAGVGGSV